MSLIRSDFLMEEDFEMLDRIAVVVPIYNVEKYIERCITSVLNQHYGQFLLILIDDGSSDNSGKICDDYAKTDDRILVVHKSNGGLSDARNTGIVLALNNDCRWICFLDGDDWIHPEFLSSLHNACSELKVSIAISEYQRTNGSEIEKCEPACPKIYCPEEYWTFDRVNATISCAKLFDIELWRDMRFPIGRINEDEFTTYKVMFRTDKIAVLNSKMYYYYQNSSSIMNKKWSLKRLDAIIALEQQASFLKDNGFLGAWKVSEKFLIYVYYDNLNEPKLRDNKTQYLDVLKGLRKHLKLYGNMVDMSKKDVPWIYQQAFPLKSCMIARLSRVKKLFNQH